MSVTRCCVQMLGVRYAPEFETLEDTLAKLEQRRRSVTVRAYCTGMHGQCLWLSHFVQLTKCCAFMLCWLQLLIEWLRKRM